MPIYCFTITSELFSNEFHDFFSNLRRKYTIMSLEISFFMMDTLKYEVHIAKPIRLISVPVGGHIVMSKNPRKFFCVKLAHLSPKFAGNLCHTILQ